MTWTRITKDESTLPPIGELVWLFDRKSYDFRPGVLTPETDGTMKFRPVAGPVQYYGGEWRVLVSSFIELKPTHWHPFPSVPEVGE